MAGRKHAARDRLALLLTHWAGMRVCEVAALTRGTVLGPSGDILEEWRLDRDQTKGSMGRVVYANSKLRKELAAYLKAKRHTQVFDLPVRRMISLVPISSALNRTISARQTCLCAVLRSRASAFRRRRSAGLRVMKIPVRMRQTRTHPGRWESPPGFKCQTRSTSVTAVLLLQSCAHTCHGTSNRPAAPSTNAIITRTQHPSLWAYPATKLPSVGLSGAIRIRRQVGCCVQLHPIPGRGNIGRKQ